MKVTFFDIRWADEGHIEMQAHNGVQFGRRPFSLGDKLSLELADDTIFCIGSQVDGKWQPCSQKSMGKYKCETCRARERNFIYTMFDGFNRDMFTDDDLAQIAGPHVVYLALFERNMYKVGVSGFHRKALRQLEQGSSYTLYLAQTANGIDARQIETLIRRSGIQDKIKSSAKKGVLLPDCTGPEAEVILRKAAEVVPDVLKEYPKLRDMLRDPFEFVTWDEDYGVTDLQKRDERVHPIKLEKNDWVSGTILAIKGPFVVLDTGEQLVSVCMKDYLGKTLDFSSKSDGFSTTKAIQNTLF